VFKDGVLRSEDDLVAFTWKSFLDDPEKNARTPVQWPMVRSVIKAMDAITEYASSENHSIEEFIVAGASKRGWISWLAAAADQRIMAVIPMVIDVLNVSTCVHHHLNVYQGFASAISDYADKDHNILEDLESEGMSKLMEDIDPFSYQDQLLLPKFIINASADEFFPPDSARFYYHALPEPIWLRYLPNASHYLGRDSSVNINEIMASTFGALISDREIPEMRWRLLDEGGLEIRTTLPPRSAKAWLCHNPSARDFRKEVLHQQNIQYEAMTIQAIAEAPWVFQFQPDQPVSGWSAFFIELHFDNAPYPDLVLTSGVRVTPDLYP
jgi:PhoPQ-activated pathogenicity-related protein